MSADCSFVACNAGIVAPGRIARGFSTHAATHPGRKRAPASARSGAVIMVSIMPLPSFEMSAPESWHAAQCSSVNSIRPSRFFESEISFGAGVCVHEVGGTGSRGNSFDAQ